MELDNIIFALQPHGGISVYWAEILRRAATNDCSWIDPYSGSGNKIRCEIIADAPLRNTENHLPISVERYWSIRSEAAKVHSSYYRIPTSHKTKLVTTVYDFTYERYRSGPARWIHHYQKMRAIRRSSKILCISESTARDTVQFGGRDLATRIEVTALAASEIFRTIDDAARALNEKYPWFEKIYSGRRVLLFVGSRTSYKRFDLAVQATRKYREGHLIVIGGGQPAEDEKLLVRELTEQGRITFLSSVAAAELPLWYNIAYALFYLSDYEGFGLPVLEAAQCGCPVLAQATSSISEVYGDQRFLLSPSPQVDEVVSSLKQLEDLQVRNALIGNCEIHAKTFSWDRCWQQTFAAYKSL